MKKLMIAAAIVCAAAVSQGAVTKWKATTGSSGVIYDGYLNTGSGYSETALAGQTMYLIAVATDTTGIGISQGKLLEAFRNDGKDFNLASYAIRDNGDGVNNGKTGSGSSAGKISGFTTNNGSADSGDFHVESGLQYNFYLATVINDGEKDWLYMSDSVPSPAGNSSTVKTLQFTATKTSSLNNFGAGDYSVGGWYSAVP